ncbi:class I SAM-dependent methyltransferase [Gemmatimonadota bacterium]
MKKNPSDYGSIWDRYVREAYPKIKAATPHGRRRLEPWRILNTTDEHYDWPGDEWGDRETAALLLDESLTTALDGKAQYLCELGTGAGRYTVIALERFQDASVLSFDVSPAFERALKNRCAAFIKSGRLRTYLLDEKPLFFFDAVRRERLLGKIDGVYSFDAMVHVDLHTLFVYWLSAARMLRPGGVLAMSVADACSENGFMKLLFDAPGVYQKRGLSGGHFMWISQDIVEATLTRLGFDVAFPEGNGRDLFISATLVDPDRGSAWFEKAGANWFAFS